VRSRRLLVAINISLVLVLLGVGIRFFGAMAGDPVMLNDPAVLAGTRATHLRYRVSKI
jgi:hypothetical protein